MELHFTGFGRKRLYDEGYAMGELVANLGGIHMLRSRS